MAKKKQQLSKYNATALRISEALKELQTVPNPNILAYSRSHNLPYQRLLQAYKGGNNRKNRQKTNLILSPKQERALEEYLWLLTVDFIDDIGFSVKREQVEKQCNTIVREAHTGAGPPPTCGIN
ncbi:hypothetical protein BCR34DRAFT_487662 [Clohesyomyces aquaticus]|uniref:Uncharacterized protein n=1 Tax=Clohesyomyces aquaticus TaxID=1231657 RepID=A0A1Y1ZHB0_9PLEO|nr:hypothetical protein BCR34DRAFT_487662 [Clohesyomyces aquaticus]